MSRHAVLYTVVLILALLGGVFYWLQHPSEEERIRKRCRVLSERVSSGPGEGNAAMVLETQRLPGLFADPVTIAVPRHGVQATYTPEELASHIARIRNSARSLRLRLYDIRVALPSTDEAQATFTARLTGAARGGENIEETAEIRAALVRRDGKWLFTSFKDVQVLER